jgi:glucose/arabinose dehydrogenase
MARVLATCCIATLAASAIAQTPAGRGNGATGVATLDPREGWVVEAGFALTIDSEGFQLPTAIAFVPEPGSGPKDPLYFVTEIRGSVKVVTNDRSVETFASDFVSVIPKRELPDMAGQVGVAGICLDPERGYVFVTFAYPDSSGVLRNNIVRFQSAPRAFSLRASGQVDFRHVFAGDESATSHQIGGCQVSGGHLYVGVADGLQAERSQDQRSTLGKILRLTTDGEAVASNPLYRDTVSDGGEVNRASYVWAYGLRNPFGLKMVEGELYVAENGDNIDRFLHIRAGENYLWDGTDRSIGARADLVFSPAIGPVQLEYAGSGTGNAWPQSYGENFFMAMSAERRAGVMRFRYSLEEDRALAPPRFLLRYRGSGMQIVSGVALGLDGLYIVPIMPDAHGRTAVLRLYYAPETVQPSFGGDLSNPSMLMEEKGCLGCHRLAGEGGGVGPRLDGDSLRERLSDRLATPRYRRTVAELERLDEEPFVSWRAERAALLSASAPQRQLEWTTYKILEPRFDNPSSIMPNLALSPAEARAIAHFLLADEGPRPPGGLTRRALELRQKYLPRPLRVWHLPVVGAIGFAAGIAATWMAIRTLGRRAA